MPKNRTHEQFRKLMTRYMAAAIAGRASYYFEEGKALREAAEAEAPESHKVKASADAQAAAQRGPRCTSTSRNVTSSAVANTLVLPSTPLSTHPRRSHLFASAAKQRQQATTSASQSPSSCS